MNKSFILLDNVFHLLRYIFYISRIEMQFILSYISQKSYCFSIQYSLILFTQSSFLELRSKLFLYFTGDSLWEYHGQPLNFFCFTYWYHIFLLCFQTLQVEVTMFFFKLHLILSYVCIIRHFSLLFNYSEFHKPQTSFFKNHKINFPPNCEISFMHIVFKEAVVDFMVNHNFEGKCDYSKAFM